MGAVSSLPLFSPLPFTVPGEVSCDPALQVWEPAAHPSGHLMLGAEQPQPPGPPPFLCLPSRAPAPVTPCPLPLFFLFAERLFAGVGGERGVEGGSRHRGVGPTVKGEVTKVGPVSPWRGRGVLGPQSCAWPSSAAYPSGPARDPTRLACTPGREGGCGLLSSPRSRCLLRGSSGCFPGGGSVTEAMFGWVSGGSEGCRLRLAASLGWAREPKSISPWACWCLCPAPHPGFSVLCPLALLGFLAITTPAALYRGGFWKLPFGYALGTGPAHWLTR